MDSKTVKPNWGSCKISLFPKKVEYSFKDKDNVFKVSCKVKFVLNASVAETTNPKLDKKKEKNKTSPSDSSPKEMVTNSDEDIGQECENNARGLLN